MSNGAYCPALQANCDLNLTFIDKLGEPPKADNFKAVCKAAQPSAITHVTQICLRRVKQIIKAANLCVQLVGSVPVWQKKG